MSEENNQPRVCRNGHRQPNVDSRFCIYCGTPLDPAQSSAQPPANSNPPPVNHQNQQRPIQNQPPANHQPPHDPRYQQGHQRQGQQQYDPRYQQQQQQQAAPQNHQLQPVPPPFNPPPVETCAVCGGDGRRLPPEKIVCAECNWLRPLTPGYSIDCSAFQWAEDGKAMSVLRSLTPLHAIAQGISNKIGRRWIEAMFNGVLLSEKQLPDIYAQAIKAARILGMSHMPDVYISGEMMWDCRTYGSDKDAFIVMGTALATNFHDDELMFLFAREMGHCRAGHALWKTVIRFLLGEQGPRKGILAGGVFAALSPSALLEGAIEMPLLAWARQAEITADRAGLLAVGDEEISRRVLLSWSLKSLFLYRQINLASWLEQQAESDDSLTKLSELTTSSTPYITRRLKLMEDFSKTPDLHRWQGVIRQYVQRSAQQTSPGPRPNPQNRPAGGAHPAQPNTDIKLKCSDCQTPMRVPQKIFEGKEQISIKCPNPKCGKMTRLKKKPNAVPNKAAIPPKAERNVSYDE